jgi:hypothetical protein
VIGIVRDGGGCFFFLPVFEGARRAVDTYHINHRNVFTYEKSYYSGLI